MKTDALVSIVWALALAVLAAALIRVASCTAAGLNGSADARAFDAACYEHQGMPEHDWKGDRCVK